MPTQAKNATKDSHIMPSPRPFYVGEWPEVQVKLLRHDTPPSRLRRDTLPYTGRALAGFYHGL